MNNLRTWVESFCLIINVYTSYLWLQHESTRQYNIIVKWLELIIFVRMLKILTLLYEIRTMRIIIETIRNLIKPLLNLYGILFTLFYTFALIGMALFGGKLTRLNKDLALDSTIPDNYHLLNFNDLCSSMVTLFCLMIVNNWMDIAHMYSIVMGHNQFYKIYFGVFYYFSVIIGINIAVAFAIDMYSSVERLDRERMMTLEKL